LNGEYYTTFEISYMIHTLDGIQFSNMETKNNLAELFPLEFIVSLFS
jgi:hypothetical protein